MGDMVLISSANDISDLNGQICFACTMCFTFLRQIQNKLSLRSAYHRCFDINHFEVLLTVEMHFLNVLTSLCFEKLAYKQIQIHMVQ